MARDTALEEIEEGMSLLRGKDLASAKVKLSSLLRKSQVVIEFIENGGQEKEGKAQHLADRSIQELLADARSCKDSAMYAYSMAGDAPESIDIKIQATKVAVTAAIATSIKDEVLPRMVYSDLVVFIERLLKEQVLRADMKHFLDGSKPVFGSKRDREQRLQNLVRMFLPCEGWAKANNLPSLLLEMAEPNRFCVKSLFKAGLFGKTLEDLAKGGHFTDFEVVIVAFFMEETEKLKGMPSPHHFFVAQFVSEAAKLYRQGCEQEALGDSAGAKDLWGRATEAARTAAAAAAPSKQQGAKASVGAEVAAKVQVRLGWESYNSGQYERAREAFAEATALAPEFSRGHMGLAYVLCRQLKRPEEGEAAYNRAVQLDPEGEASASAVNTLANVLEAKGDRAGAEEAYRKAIGLAPEVPSYHKDLGRLLTDTSRLDEGIAEYRKALELDPEYAPAHHNLGGALKDQGDLAGAVASYRRALELDPEDALAHNNLGNALSDQGDLAGAVASYRRALELDPEDAAAHSNLGIALKAQGDLAGAVASYRRALELDPEHAHVHNNLGVALKAQKDLPGAEAAYRRALEARPDYVDALGNLGGLLRDRGGAARLREAEDLVRRAVALDPGSAIKRWNLGLVLEKKGDWAGAEAQFREGMALDPKDPDYARKVGEMRRKQGLEG